MKSSKIRSIRTFKLIPACRLTYNFIRKKIVHRKILKPLDEHFILSVLINNILKNKVRQLTLFSFLQGNINYF